MVGFFPSFLGPFFVFSPFLPFLCFHFFPFSLKIIQWLIIVIVVSSLKKITCVVFSEGFRSIVNQKISYGCEQESQDLI
jgi:hypothetical protein